jgi:hypothetical protein
VDIDNDYSNTFTFSNVAEQTAFFLAKTQHTYEGENAFTYMRKEKSVRVGNNIESMFDLSYIMFQNSNFSNKWFYAFITDMRYVNDVTTEVFFEIDVLQSWYFDVELKDCYVEREHVANDTIGLHLVEENLNVGDYTIKAFERFDELTPLSIVVSTTTNYDGTADVLGGLYTGVYSGNAYLCSSDEDDINDYIEVLNLAGKAEAINNIFMCPTALVRSGETGLGLVEISHIKTELTKTITKNLGDVDGYYPHNNKLFTYPYNFLVVENNHGQSNIYKYELSSDADMEFMVSCDIGTSPTVYLFPKYYKGMSINWEELLTLSGYPLCNWTTDIYKIWQAQNAVSAPLAVAGSALALGVGVATVNPIAITTGVLGVAGSIGAYHEKSILPNPIHGSVSGGGNVSQGTQNFFFYKKTIRAEFARIIDSFFDRFGYKVNELKIPNLKTRLNWNYIKTIECNISGNIPNNDLKKIHSIYNKGVTFWHNDNVGDYHRNNATL